MQRLLEAFDDLWDSFVDPAEALLDGDDTRWSLLGGRGSGRGPRHPTYCRQAEGRLQVRQSPPGSPSVAAPTAPQRTAYRREKEIVSSRGLLQKK